jgi:hypothetical protein
MAFESTLSTQVDCEVLFRIQSVRISVYSCSERNTKKKKERDKFVTNSELDYLLKTKVFKVYEMSTLSLALSKGSI